MAYIINIAISFILMAILSVFFLDMSILNSILWSLVAAVAGLAYTVLLEGPLNQTNDQESESSKSSQIKSVILGIIIFCSFFGAVIWFGQ